MLTEEHWELYARQGFLDLGPVCKPAEAAVLRRSAAELDGDQQLDRSAAMETPAFLELMHHPLMYEVCARIYGPDAPVMVFRAALTALGPGGGPWRQNAGELSELDRDEVITVVVGASAGGVIEVIPGSHRAGLLDPAPGGVSPSHSGRRRLGDQAVATEIEGGSALLLHRWLVHRPATPGALGPAAAFAFWFVDGRARSIHTGYPALPMLAGEAPSGPFPCVEVLEREIAAGRERFDAVEAYAQSLEVERARLAAEVERLTLLCPR